MLARRLLILLAVVMGLTALAAGVAPREAQRESASASPTPPAATPVERPLERTLSVAGDGEQRIVVRRGRVVRLTVEGDVLDSVVLGELEVEAIDPESPARFELMAEELGSYPITLLDAGRRIGVLEVRE